MSTILGKAYINSVKTNKYSLIYDNLIQEKIVSVSSVSGVTGVTKIVETCQRPRTRKKWEFIFYILYI